MSLDSVLDSLPKFKNENIAKSIVKSYSIINRPEYETILCSISGGSDSDVMLDIIYRVDEDKKVTYVWFDTGLEYKATKEHLKYLENRYGIEIRRKRAIKPIPVCTREYGQPFLSKNVSERIETLQRYDFKFENKPYSELLTEYPKISSVIKWWCNEYPYDNSIYNIEYNKYLKEFLIFNPPTFKISAQCCNWAKKKVKKQLNYDLMIVGIRKVEGGIRSVAYENCYSTNLDEPDSYRPLFWFKDEDKQVYESAFDIKHSDCYEKWGFKRTGCVGCPYNRNLFSDLEKVKRYESNMYKAVNNVFKDSYEYTRQYREFICEMKAKEKGLRRLF